MLLLLEAVFIAGIIALGIFISVVSSNELEATQIAMLVAVPSFLVSGFTWPLQAIPGPVRVISRILPLTYFVNSLRDLALKEIGLRIMLPGIMYLACLAVVFYPASILALRQNIKHDVNSGKTVEGLA